MEYNFYWKNRNYKEKTIGFNNSCGLSSFYGTYLVVKVKYTTSLENNYLSFNKPEGFFIRVLTYLKS